MDQLSASESVRLALETPGLPQHAAALMLLDPGAAAGLGFESLLALTEERIRSAPRFGRRLREVAGGLDSAWLVDDPGFDVRHHVHRIAVPAPGGRKELAELAAFLFAPPLDRSRPLWELWWIEGLAEGRTALLAKSHRCLGDGAAGTTLGELLCDLEPRPQRPERSSPRELAPDPGELRVALRAARSLTTRPAAALQLGASLLRHGLGRLRSLRDPEAPPLPFWIPKVSFNASPGPRRAIACASVALPALTEIRKHFDVRVSDVVLALTGSAVRRYLENRGELPRKSLVATIAVSLPAGPASDEPTLASAAVPWGTERADPVARLLRIHRAASRAREFARRHDAQLVAQLGRAMLPGFLSLTLRTGAAAAASSALTANAFVESLRSTSLPLYVGGAQVESMVPLTVLAPGLGLGIGALRYNGRIDIGFTVDPDLVPDPWDLADGIPLALDELRAAIGAA